ncbi:DMT family transporter [Kordiimonas aestuarii]|uniref:DMT family transporter n=1 Tax=Kordiimonas aestuarii TaxID=1005925 RepID=UPI0021D19820|nr:DMT family transporter [Kordiimonas aestuarii]
MVSAYRAGSGRPEFDQEDHMTTTPASPAQMGVKQWLMLAVLSVVWGASFFSIEIAVTELPPMTIVTVRVGLAALVLLTYMKMTGISLPFTGRADWRVVLLALVLMGFFNNIVPSVLIVWGQTHITSSLASILNATMPLFTVFMAHFFTSDEKLTSGRLVGVLVGFTGVVFIVGPYALEGLLSGVAGQAAVLGAAFSYAIAVVIGRRFVRLGLKPVQMAFGQAAAATLMIGPAALMIDQPYLMPAPSWQVVAALISLATISTAFAYLLYFRLIAEAGATNASLVTLMIPVVASTLGVGFLGEVFEPTHGVGLALIGVGLLLIDGRLTKRRKVRAAAVPPQGR